MDVEWAAPNVVFRIEHSCLASGEKAQRWCPTREQLVGLTGDGLLPQVIEFFLDLNSIFDAAFDLYCSDSEYFLEMKNGKTQPRKALVMPFTKQS